MRRELAIELIKVSFRTDRRSDRLMGLLWQTVDCYANGDPHAGRPEAKQRGAPRPRLATSKSPTILPAERIYSSGTSRSISSSQARADMSDGARQSPRGDSEPPCDTLGPLGIADRLNWLNE